MEGIIFDIKHYAIHDGPGIRQTVFLKGCPLGCWWCHNPESRSKEPFTYLKKEKIDDKTIEFPQTVGYKISVSELLREIENDVMFFEESNGGVTFSGGEPFMQFDFLMSLLKKCKSHDIHTCVDTTGFVKEEKILKVSGFTDLFLFDLKLMDNELHKKYTGVPNDIILSNLKKLDSIGSDIWIRYPMIPGINDDESNIFRMLDFLSKLKKKPQINILPYHKIGSSKYKRFGIPYKMNGIREPEEQEVENVKILFENAGYKVVIGG